jgi:outer membrane receptor for ferrienterochelin and colicins
MHRPRSALSLLTASGRPNWLFLLLGAGLLATPAAAATITGVVTDSTTLAAISGVRVQAVPSVGATSVGAMTNDRGRFEIRSLPPGSYVIVIWGIGWERRRVGPVSLALGDSTEVAISTVPNLIRLNPVVVTASRRPEKALYAPASIAIVNSRAIAARPAITPVSHLRGIAGVDIAAKGISQASVVTRGFNSAQSAALLAMTDYRYTGIPSLRYNLFHFLPTPNEDMERIELVRGPGAALYGPNSERGVLHILTRSPLEAPGTAASLTMGERSVAQAALRHAAIVAPNLGFKVTGQYFTGRDWEFTDPVEAKNRSAAIAAGADPETLRIGLRDDRNERAAVESQIEWRPAPDATLIASGGYHRAISDLEQTALGGAQVKGWSSSYAQIRGSKGRLFAQGFLNASGSGETYFLRTGQPVVDQSRLWVAQIQHGVDVGSSLALTYGLDGQWTDPRTGGTIMGRNENHDAIREAGAYVHSTARLHPKLEVVAAIRLDDHSRFPNPVVSPRAGVVFTPLEGHNVRLTYNRAFGTPSTDDLFADLRIDSLTPLPYAVRVEGVPDRGFTFRRGSSGPLMRSPFTPSAAGGPSAYLPPDATLLWDEVVAIAQSQGTDLSGVTPPTSSDVASDLRLLQTTDGTFVSVPDATDLSALKPTITNVIELGYRGLVGGRVRVGIDGYYSKIENFIGHLRVITPNVFLEPATLEAYLASQGVSSADTVAQALSGIPLGTITPQEAQDPFDLILAVRNFGSVAYWGADVSVLAALTDRLTLGGSCSWVSRDLFHDVAGLEDLALNAPARKGSLEVTYRDPVSGFSADGGLRSAAAFPVLSGVYAGEVDSYTLVDFRLGIRISAAPRASLAVAAENLLDHRHREFVGSPTIGRQILARLGIEF